MDILEIYNDNLKSVLHENEWVLLDVYEDDDALSELASVTIKNVMLNVSSAVKAFKIKLEELKKAINEEKVTSLCCDDFPEILLIRNSKLNVKIPSFSRVAKIVDILREKIPSL